MVLNMIILGLLQVATIYCKTFKEFLAVRSLFGLFMGGVYGNAIAMALEHCPVNARGLMSGILQQGYAFGYVLAACANLGVGGSTESWKVSHNPIIVHGSEANYCRLCSGSLLVSPLPLDSLACASLKVNNFLRPRRTATRTSPLVHSGRKQSSCLAKSGRCAFTVSFL